MFKKVLIANRGAIACRIIRTLRRMGIRSVAVYSEADRHSLHVLDADESICLGAPPAAQSYLAVDKVLAVAKATGAEAIHPGYGFLSENAGFAESCAREGIVFIGPKPDQMRAFGLKHTAREIAEANNVPLLPGTSLLENIDGALEAAGRIGYPVMLKSSAGGGGIGMSLCRDAGALRGSFAAVERLSLANFGSAGLFLEKFVEAARHIEVQIFGNGKEVVALGERDCSVQRRNQKVIEETPAPGISRATRVALFDAAVKLGSSVNYESAGTVEFIYDAATGRFYFLEVNTRLQVEHGVTEQVTGIDLVEWMVRQAAGEMESFKSMASSLSRLGTEPRASASDLPDRHSIQVRIYAEDPAHNFQPRAGKLSKVAWPEHARIETWIESGAEISPFYDSMVAKIIVDAPSRAEALDKLSAALSATTISGTETNLHYLRQVIATNGFREGGVTTSFLGGFQYERQAIEVLDPGTQTTVQDYPGRLGYWHVGVPPSGPMDSLAFRLANRAVGNNESAAALEIAVTGPTLRFDRNATIAICGANMQPKLDGKPIPLWEPLEIEAGSTLRLGSVEGPGARCYVAIAGGIDVPEYLGSRSTFILGKFGGVAGRTLRAGDVIRALPSTGEPSSNIPKPEYTEEWEIAVTYGPHGAPDFFAQEYIDTFFSTRWKVHYNSDRTGVRLIGPKPLWARKDGGEAGLHPSNIHDNAYAIGTVDFTGDMPVILGPDGPSLGGFVCPATIVQADLWKLGQLRPDALVRFRPVTQGQAEAMERAIDEGGLPQIPASAIEQPVLRSRSAEGSAPQMVSRQDGDRYLLIEYGPNVLDFHLRFRVHALEERIRAEKLRGIIDITPGIRSLHIHYDNRTLSRHALLDAVDAAEETLKQMPDIEVPSRIVHLPLSWDDPQTQLAIRKYMQSVRPDAPWCPRNIEFIRRINGLGSQDDVHRIVFDASYLVLGLGDVYLGAPVATPVDPRHRLVTTKYNPARTWTPENAVGIGGAYLCVYGMEGPGGYQFVGRTVQMWNTYKSPDPGTPWLLRFFDQIRFHPVSAGELLEYRDAFPHGRYAVKTEDTTFRLSSYDQYLSGIRESADAFKRTQQAAFDEERAQWIATGQHEFTSASSLAPAALTEIEIPEGCDPVRSPITASVWSVAVEPGQRVDAGQRLLVLEAMKMEVAVAAPSAGVVESILCAEGAMITAGQNLLILRAEASA